jgi:branched-chain amino acid transport system permease protein
VDLEILVENVLNAVTAGITIGCIYGLMCIGLGLIFGIMRIVNFAQGELLMLGMFVSFYLVSEGRILSALGPYWGPFIGAMCAAPAIFAGGALLHRFLISRVSGLRTVGSLDEGHFGQLIVTLGIFLIGPLYHGATVFLNKAKLVAFFVAVLAAVALYVTLEYTRLGKALRAAADNPTAATYMGIDVDRAYRIAFGLGSGITAVAGGLMATYISFTPFVGFDYVIIMYSGVVLGGMGSIFGAFWGGVTVGFVQQFSALILPPQLQNAAIFVVFLMIVLLRPQGLFGRSAERA